jgi:hypothetical protein
LAQGSIDAGLISSPMLVVGGLTMNASYALVNQSLAGTVIVLRLCVLFFSYWVFFGIFVFFILILILIYIAAIKSLNVPYTSSFSPPTIYKLLGMLVRLPFSKQALGYISSINCGCCDNREAAKL